MPAVAMIHEVDPKEALLEKLGDISGVEVFNNQVLVAIYTRPEKTMGGIILPEKHRDEDIYQGKVGLIVAAGPEAFVSTDKWKFPDVSIGDWVFFKASDGLAVTMNKGSQKDNVVCRLVDDIHIRGRVLHPDQVW